MLPGDGIEDGRRDIASVGIGVAAGHDLGLVDERVETLRLPGADAAGIVRIILGVCSEHLQEGTLGFGHELIRHRFVDIGVSR